MAERAGFLARRAGFWPKEPASWPEGAGFGQKSRLSGQKEPALAKRAGLHRLWPASSGPKPASLAKEAGFGRRSRLLQGAACCSVLLSKEPFRAPSYFKEATCCLRPPSRRASALRPPVRRQLAASVLPQGGSLLPPSYSSGRRAGLHRLSRLPFGQKPAYTGLQPALPARSRLTPAYSRLFPPRKPAYTGLQPASLAEEAGLHRLSRLPLASRGSRLTPAQPASKEAACCLRPTREAAAGRGGRWRRSYASPSTDGKPGKAEFQRCLQLAEDAAEREEEQALPAALSRVSWENAVTTNENRPRFTSGCQRERARDAEDRGGSSLSRPARAS